MLENTTKLLDHLSACYNRREEHIIPTTELRKLIDSTKVEVAKVKDEFGDKEKLMLADPWEAEASNVVHTKCYECAYKFCLVSEEPCKDCYPRVDRPNFVKA